jgi:D-alanyl-lipoteichoic acid acyltransferase DltB (MBOAT superfamily)
LNLELPWHYTNWNKEEEEALIQTALSMFLEFESVILTFVGTNNLHPRLLFDGNKQQRAIDKLAIRFWAPAAIV